jgi:hypothetical protein
MRKFISLIKHQKFAKKKKNCPNYLPRKKIKIHKTSSCSKNQMYLQENGYDFGYDF